MGFRDLVHRKGNRAAADVNRSVTSLYDRVNQAFADFFDDGHASLSSLFGDGDLTPRIDVSETDTHLVVTAELPGIDENDVDLSLTRTELIIAGKKERSHEESRAGFHVSERSYGSFQRTIPLPGEINPDAVEATFSKGVLTVRLPRSEKEKSEARKIRIQS